MKKSAFKLKNMAFIKQTHREQLANVTAFSGTGLADFAGVAQTQVLCSHCLSRSHRKQE